MINHSLIQLIISLIIVKIFCCLSQAVLHYYTLIMLFHFHPHLISHCHYDCYGFSDY